MALDTSGFVPKGNLNTDETALGKSGRKDTVRKVLKRLSGYRFLIIISLILAAVSVLFTLMVPIKIGDAIDCIEQLASGADSASGPVLQRAITDSLIKAAVFALIVGVSTYVMNLINNRITYHTVRDIRNDTIEKIGTLPLSYLDSHSQGDIVSRVVADADQFADGLLMGFTQAFTGIMTIIGTLVFMLRMNVAITLVVVCVTPLSLFIARFISSRTFKMFKKQSIERGEQTALIDEMIGNAKVVKAFNKEKDILERFDEINGRLSESSLKAIFYSSLTNPCTRFVNAVCYALVAMTGSYFAIMALGGNTGRVISGITVGTLTVFLSYANQYTKPFNEISSVISELQGAVACAARVFEILDEPSEVNDPDVSELKDVDGMIDIKDVDFSYVPDKELITDLNLNVTPGQRVAIVGPTGCGKTTMINLLMRFYDVDAGSISVDGTDIRKVTRDSLRSSYGMVLQDTWLTSATIADNIRFGAPNASMEEIVEAAKASGAHSFIRRLPDKYDTYIGEGGAELSQGQKQLLCITRVMLNIPPMLILDEATSSIDTRTEIRIQNAFHKMMQGRTSFIVAHRLSTIRESDVILVMKDGHIIEQGDHNTLLARGGFYYELYNSQFTDSAPKQ
ncbi:MAG: ABC transporter ATP-binding protein/permease [Lachnospiraceae bacterium]|nr:ABC transporter ATP-binding protein/permease [Lachnospiraceae bacterium]